MSFSMTTDLLVIQMKGREKKAKLRDWVLIIAPLSFTKIAVTSHIAKRLDSKSGRLLLSRYLSLR